MCPDGATYLSVDYKNPTRHVGLVQIGHHHYHQNVTCSHHDKLPTLC